MGGVKNKIIENPVFRFRYELYFESKANKPEQLYKNSRTMNIIVVIAACRHCSDLMLQAKFILVSYVNNIDPSNFILLLIFLRLFSNSLNWNRK